MSEETKSCQCCGKPLFRRRSESANSYANRRACSKTCGGKLRFGIITRAIEPGNSIEEAMEALGRVIGNWRTA